MAYQPGEPGSAHAKLKINQKAEKTFHAHSTKVTMIFQTAKRCRNSVTIGLSHRKPKKVTKKGKPCLSCLIGHLSQKFDVKTFKNKLKIA